MTTKNQHWIDFSKIPVDTVVDVKMSYGFDTVFFVGVDNNGDYLTSGYPSITMAGAMELSDISKDVRISSKNPWLPWFGGDCPVPPNCMIEFINSNKCVVSGIAANFNWKYGCRDFDFAGGIAYRLLESLWQTIDGVCNEN